MWGAAPHPTRRLLFAAYALVTGAALCLGVASAAVATPSVVPAQIWGVEVTASLAKSLTVTRAQELRRGGLNVLVVDRGRVGATSFVRVTKIAKQSRLVLVSVRPLTAAGRRALCAKLPAGAVCGVAAASPQAAQKLARSRVVPVVVVRVKSLAQIKLLEARVPGSRIVALPTLGRTLNEPAWRRAIASARLRAQLDLAVAPAAGSNNALSAYVRLLGERRTSSAAPPAAPQSLRVTAVSASSVTLAWEADADAVSYRLYRSGALAATTSSTAATLGGLPCGSAAVFEVEWLNAAGTASPRASVSASTAACPAGGGGAGGAPADVLPPAAPLGLAAGATSTTSITVAWSASTDNVGVVGYDLVRGGVAAGSAVGTSYTFSGLSCGSTYSLGVKAFDAAGNRSAQTSLNASTATCAVAADTTPPSTPASLSASGIGATGLTLSWPASTDNVGVASYAVTRNGSALATVTGTSYAATGLTCGTSYSFGVSARDAAGNSSAARTASFSTSACSGDTTNPSAPPALTASSITTSSVTLSWNASSDNVGVTGYGVYRNGASLGNTTVRTYAASGLACGTAYTFEVDAYDAAGNRSTRSALSTTTSSCPLPPPSGSTLYLSPSGSDSAACTSAAPCRSFNRAYTVASAGQTVEVAAGSYGTQTINADAAKTSAADVVFAPAAGAAVTLGALNVFAKHFEVRDMTLSEWNLSPGTDDVTLRNLNVRGGIFITGATNVSIVGGSVGPGVDYHPQFAPWPAGSPISNIVIDGVDFHDWTRTSAAVHTECLQIAGGDWMTIRNSTFRNCAVMDLSITEYNGSGPPQNYTIENNVFAPSVSGGFYSLQFNSNASALRNILIRNNSSTQEFLIDNAQPTITNVRVVANVAPMSSYLCSSRVTYTRNVWQGATCNASDKNAPSGFRNAAALDYRLSAGSAAINAGDPTNFPATDMDGQARPLGGAPDAGAYESG